MQPGWEGMQPGVTRWPPKIFSMSPRSYAAVNFPRKHKDIVEKKKYRGTSLLRTTPPLGPP
jgi:hypothetical protein